MDSISRSEPHCNEDASAVAVKRKRRKISPSDASSMSCVVCGSPAFGYNFDVISCESCKAFFRRNAQKAANRLSQCVRDGACAVNSNSRKHCPACRMKKCIEAGMRKELITPMEKLVNRANYRGKRSERKSNRRDNSSDRKSLHSEEATPYRHAVSSHSSNDEPVTPTESKLCASQAYGASSDEASTPAGQVSICNGVKESPTSSEHHSAVSSSSQSLNIPENFTNLPPSLLKNIPAELLAKAKAFMTPTSPTVEDNDIAHQCAMMIYGRMKHDVVKKKESPPHDPASFMGAMHGQNASFDSSFADKILKFMNPVEAIKMMYPTPLPLGRLAVLREDIFLEYFNNVKAGLMNIAKPLKKEEIMKTHLSEMPTNLEGSFNHMENMIRRVIAVLKCLPQFIILTRELQIALLKRSIHGLFAFCGALAYDANHNAFRIIYEEEDGEINTFFLDFQTYISQGLKDIRSTSWESFSSILHNDKVEELIKVNKVIFNQITSYTRNDRLLIITLLCTRFFSQPVDTTEVNVNEGMAWLMRRTHSELMLFIKEYIIRKSTESDTDHQFHQIISLFDAIKPLERAGEVLSNVVRLDGLNPLMREFLTFSKLANMDVPSRPAT